MRSRDTASYLVWHLVLQFATAKHSSNSVVGVYSTKLLRFPANRSPQ